MTVEASKKLLESVRGDLQSWRGLTSQVESVAIVYTSWYSDIIDSLRDSAKVTLKETGIDQQKITEIKVSGSWELPLAVAEVCDSRKPNIILALGCIVKGQTPHFDILCNTVAGALMKLQLDKKTPLGFGVLTVNSLVEAMERSDKGAEAAEAALRTWVQLQELKGNK